MDKNFHLWTIKDAKDGDVLVSEWGNPFIFNGVVTTRYVGAYGGINSCKEFELCNTTEDWTSLNVSPAAKEQRGILFQKMKEAGYDWDTEKKELKQIEQEQTELPNGEDYGIDSLYHAARILEKTLGDVEGYQSDDGILEHKCAIEAVNRLYKHKPSWSEEDARNVQDIDSVLFYDKNLPEDTRIRLRNWLESLKEKRIWKPTDEQITSLRWMLNKIPYCQQKEIIIGLFDQIQSL